MNTRKVAYEQYGSMIQFNREVTGDEPMPRSGHIAKIGWANDGRPYALFVEFFGYKGGNNSAYIYETTDYNLWKRLVNGVQLPGSNRESTGVVFHRDVKSANLPYEKVF